MKKTRIFAILFAAILVVSVLCTGLTVSAAEENVAKGKSYKVSQQFQMGGADAGWGWDDNAPISYPDDGVKLTDGVVAANDASYTDAAWAGFTDKAPQYSEIGYSYIRVDLEAEYDLTKLVLFVGTTFLKNGIGATNMTVSFYAVDDMDGNNATLLSEVSPVDDESVAVVSVTANLDTPAKARYIEIRTTRGGWMFISEFEAYATAASGGSDKTDDDKTSSSSSSSSTSSASSTSSTSSTVPTGDAGLLGFAALAVVAVAGTAVAVKIRR